MNITTSKRDLLRVAKRMAAIAEKKSSMPILACVLLRADGNSLTLIATDLFQSLTTSIVAEVTARGSVAVAAKDLLDRATVLPEGPIEIVLKGESLTLKSKGSARKFTMRGLPGDDYPPVPTPDPGAPSFKLEVDALSRIVALTAPCVSTDETRASLNSLRLEWQGDILRAVSTDGHRLAKAEIKVSSHASTAFLIPLKPLKEVQRMCEEIYATPTEDGATRTLTVIQSGPQAFFIGAGATFSVKLVDAEFPPYAQVIPQNTPKQLRAPRVALSEAVKAVSVAADDKSNGVKLAISNGMMRLSSQSAQAGDGVDEVVIDYVGPNLAIGFNSRYVGDALNGLTSDEVLLGLNGDLDPIVVRPATDEGVDALFVLMPMRI